MSAAAAGLAELLAGKAPVVAVRMERRSRAALHAEASFGNRTPQESAGTHKHIKYCTLQRGLEEDSVPVS